MEIYLVGGAVRDKLLGFPVTERDWVVVGAAPGDLLRLGYKQVGKEFPVFLHPQTAEEYALARKERKVAPGYTGFEFDTSPDVSLEEDLLRRDLTINAMAETLAGECIDPYHGREDLKHKLLRHVSPAFAEDPVRILRVARFAARYASLGFTVASETQILMKKMVASGEVNALVPERVWKEFERALGEKSPAVFFEVLANCHALPVLFPGFAVDGPGIAALKEATKYEAMRDTKLRFAVLMYAASEKEIKALCQRYRAPAEYRDMALLVATYGKLVENFLQLTPIDILDFFLRTDAFRRKERFQQFLSICKMLALVKNKQYLGDDIWEICTALNAVSMEGMITVDKKGFEIGAQLREERLNKLVNLLQKLKK